MFKKYEKRNKYIRLLCDQDEINFLKREARKKGITVSDMIRELIRKEFFEGGGK